MNITEFPRESPQKIVCGRALFPLLFAAFTWLQPVVDPRRRFSITILGLMAVSVAGLLLRDRQRSACRIVRTVMPTRSQDRMTGVVRWAGHFTLWTSPVPSLAIGVVHTIVAITGVPGLVMLEDTLLPKRFATAPGFLPRIPSPPKARPGGPGRGPGPVGSLHGTLMGPRSGTSHPS
ncbi:MAG: hypothetical protein D6736_02170 [Nitrospinota bacterium]|nr:MAG: hypothetical protein D6736_02170 [Nitrospinota bacterium]